MTVAGLFRHPITGAVLVGCRAGKGVAWMDRRSAVPPGAVIAVGPPPRERALVRRLHTVPQSDHPGAFLFVQEDRRPGGFRSVTVEVTPLMDLSNLSKAEQAAALAGLLREPALVVYADSFTPGRFLIGLRVGPRIHALSRPDAILVGYSGCVPQHATAVAHRIATTWPAWKAEAEAERVRTGTVPVGLAPPSEVSTLEAGQRIAVGLAHHAGRTGEA